MKDYYVYILASKKDGVLYIGVTNDLVGRVYEHKNDIVKGFTQKYFVKKLVYYEVTKSVVIAIQREKQLKKWKREWKIALIEEFNPEWNDLYYEIGGTDEPLDLQYDQNKKITENLTNQEALSEDFSKYLGKHETPSKKLSTPSAGKNFE